MDRVVISDEIRSCSYWLNSASELCDESGRVLGDFVPTKEADAQRYEWARTAFSDEEIEQARNEPDGRTTTEVLLRITGV